MTGKKKQDAGILKVASVLDWILKMKTNLFRELSKKEKNNIRGWQCAGNAGHAGTVGRGGEKWGDYT